MGNGSASERRVLGSHDFKGALGASRMGAIERVCGSVTIWEMRAEAAELEVRSTPEDAEFFTFTFVVEGRVLAKRRDEPWRAFSDSLIVAPYGVDRRLRFDGVTRLLAARLPKSELAGFVTHLPETPQVLSDQRVLERALLAFLDAVISDARPGSAIDRYAIEHLVLEMCGAILLDRLGTLWTQGTPSTALRDRALAVIAQQCEDPDLTPVRLAQSVQSSLRQLQAVFAEADLTIAGEIRRHRARLARATLTDSRFDVLSIEQVAERSGFNTTMSMRRALKDVYGTGPKELRRSRETSTEG